MICLPVVVFYLIRKISDGIARIELGMQDKIILGNLDAKRDWGYAPDYVEAMWLMLQQDRPEDYVIATGDTHSIREFLDVAFNEVGLNSWNKYVGHQKLHLKIWSKKWLIMIYLY